MKNLPENAGALGSMPGLGRSLGEGNGNLLQYSSHGERSLGRGGYSPWGHKRVRHNLVTKQQQCEVEDTVGDTMAVSSKVNILLPYHPARAFLGIYPRELKIYSK